MKSRYNQRRRRKLRKERDAQKRQSRRINKTIPDEDEPLPVAPRGHRWGPNEQVGSRKRPKES